MQILIYAMCMLGAAGVASLGYYLEEMAGVSSTLSTLLSVAIIIFGIWELVRDKSKCTKKERAY